MERLKENDTYEVAKIGENFGVNEQYYCLYLQIFKFKPWWYLKGVEFRPFRNIRIYKKYKNLTFQKIGYFSEWLLEPAFTIQIYNDGKPCDGMTNKTTTVVTFQCGSDNRIVSFKETKKCKFYEILFETPFNCAPKISERIVNGLAITQHGKIELDYMYALVAVLAGFVVGFVLLAILKKTRLY